MGIFIVINDSCVRGALTVRCAVEVISVFSFTSGENLKLPKAVLRLVDDAERKIPVDFGVSWFVVCPVPSLPGAFRFFVFKMPVFRPLAAGAVTTGFGLNCAWSKIDQFDQSSVFAASHTLVGGD